MASILVTGANSGIGLATALALGRAGHAVLATVRDNGRAAPLADAVAKERLPISLLTMDVDSDASVAQTIGAVFSQGGTIDALVNNAGIERTGSVEELPIETFRAAMETNYFGALRCIKAVLPHMRQRRAGCIVNVTSLAGRISLSPMGAYAASKFALEALSEALAQEAKPFNVRVAIVEPGLIATPMADRIAVPPTGSGYPQGRRLAELYQVSAPGMTPPADVADAIRGIIESGTWRLRHLVGDACEPFLGWRRGMTDEAWVEVFALADDAWYERIQRDLGVDSRPRA